MVKLQGIPCSLVLTFRILGLNSFDRAFFLPPVWCPAGFSWFPVPTTLNKATLVFNAFPCSTLYTLVVLFLFEEPNPILQVTRVVQLGASNPTNLYILHGDVIEKHAKNGQPQLSRCFSPSRAPIRPRSSLGGCPRVLRTSLEGAEHLLQGLYASLREPLRSMFKERKVFEGFLWGPWVRK